MKPSESSTRFIADSLDWEIQSALIARHQLEVARIMRPLSKSPPIQSPKGDESHAKNESSGVLQTPILLDVSSLLEASTQALHSPSSHGGRYGGGKMLEAVDSAKTPRASSIAPLLRRRSTPVTA